MSASSVSFWSKPLNIALLTTLFGFGLTYGVGFLLVQQYQDRRDARSLEHQQKLDDNRRIEQEIKEIERRREQRVEAVNKISQIMMDRRVKQEMVTSSLNRRASLSEILDRKKEYDAAYVAWNRDFGFQLNQLKHTLLNDDKTKYEPIIAIFQDNIVLDGFFRIDRGITEIFDSVYSANLANKEAKVALSNVDEIKIGKVRDLSNALRECTTLMIMMLIDVANNGDLKQEILKRREDECGKLEKINI